MGVDKDLRNRLRDVDVGALRELARQGEHCLHGTVQLALAADQRATTMAGICGAAAVALAAAVAVLFSAERPDAAMIVAFATGGLVLFVASVVCAWASRPIDFHVAGYEPRALSVAASQENWMLIYLIEDLQRRIDANRLAREAETRQYELGLLIAASAIPLAVAAYVVVPYLSRLS